MPDQPVPRDAAVAAPLDSTRRFVPGLLAPAARPGPLPRYCFVGGHNDPDHVPSTALAEAAVAVIRREGAQLAMYNLGTGPLGYLGLRRCVADKLARRQGIRPGADDILITSGSGQGLDLVTQMFLAPGDTVLVEALSFEGAMRRFRKAGAKLLGMAMDEGGILVEPLAVQLRGLRASGTMPKFLYTMPTVHNPTGGVMPAGRRAELLRVARAFGVLIVEDDCYADLVWSGGDPPPALRALDPGCVVYLGSFSKSVLPAVRLDYMVADWDILSRALPLKSDAGTGALDQMVVAEFLGGHEEAHTDLLRTTLHAKMRVMQEAVAREFGSAAECVSAKGGIFLWLKLPDTVDVRTLVAPAARAGVAFNPGPDWAADPDTARSCLRLCFALPSASDIRDGVAELARVCFEQTGIPAHGANRRRAAGP